MNKHSKIIVIILLTVIIALGTSIVMFHINVSKNANNTGNDPNVSEIENSNSYLSVFEDNSGLFGLKDSDGTVVLEPEWTELSPIGKDFFKAKLITRSGALYGIIDRNGNITVSFVYDEIKKLSEYVYALRLKDTGEYMFYNCDFELVLPISADSYSIEGSNLCIKKDKDKFIYNQIDSFSLVKVELPRSKRPMTLSLKIEDTMVLSLMESTQWSIWGDNVILFLDMLRRNKTEGLSEIIDNDALRNITAFVETEHMWKGRISDDIYIYTSQNDEETNLYLKSNLIIPNEEETENISLIIEFKKDESGKWLISDASFE